MRLLKIKDIYINPDQIVSIHSYSGYVHMSDGQAFKMDTDAINQILVFISSGTLETDVETAKNMLSEFKSNGLLDSATLTKLGKFMKKLG